MKRVLKKAKVDFDTSIISASTDEKTFSGKRIENFLFGLFFCGISLFAFYTLIEVLIGTPGNWNGVILRWLWFSEFELGWFSSIGLFFMGIVFLVVSILSFLLGIYLIRAVSEWFFILYPDDVLYKRRKKSGGYETVTFPISDIKKCYITRKRKNTRVPVYSKSGGSRSFIDVSYHVNVHLAYENKNEIHYISMTNSDGYGELNKTVSYLQNERNVPVYFNVVEPEKYEDIDEIEFLKRHESELVEFNGDLKVFDKPNTQMKHSLF